MIHIIRKGSTTAPTFVLLHGTGGDERNLLPLVPQLNEQATVISLRGDVNENGALRFFKRTAEGVYDLDDLATRGENMHQFLLTLLEEHSIDPQNVVFVGFSNGANMAIHLLLKAWTPFNKGILFAPMYPVEVPPRSLEQTHVFLSMGKNDPIVSLAHSQQVIDLFSQNGASVTTHWVNSHEITLPALKAAHNFLTQLN